LNDWLKLNSLSGGMKMNNASFRMSVLTPTPIVNEIKHDEPIVDDEIVDTEEAVDDDSDFECSASVADSFDSDFEDYERTPTKLTMSKSCLNVPIITRAISKEKSGFGEMSTHDFLRLVDGWLNDTIINNYLEMLQKLPCCQDDLFLSTFFWSRMTKDRGEFHWDRISTWESLPRWVSYKRIWIPMNVSKNHWTIAIVDTTQDAWYEVAYFDPYQAYPKQFQWKRPFLLLLSHVFSDCDPEAVQFRNIHLHDKQTGSIDCGVWILQYIKFSCFGFSLETIKQALMRNFRSELSQELAQGKIFMTIQNFLKQ
jgi:Ulp1 family protease